MSKEKIQILADNEREWRVHILTSVDKISDDVLDIKLKGAKAEGRMMVISSILGGAFGILVSIIAAVLK